jgi:hypothetical protein
MSPASGDAKHPPAERLLVVGHPAGELRGVGVRSVPGRAAGWSEVSGIELAFCAPQLARRTVPGTSGKNPTAVLILLGHDHLRCSRPRCLAS